MEFRVVELEKFNNLNLELAEMDFEKDMQQVNEYEEYITNSQVDLTLMLNTYKMELGQAF